MKIILVALSLLAGAWAQEFVECGCGMFSTTPLGELEIHRLPNIHIENCRDEMQCRDDCRREFELVFDQGGLDFKPHGHNASLGEESCAHIKRVFGVDDFPPHEVYGCYSLCRGPWTPDGDSSRRDLLCCEGGHFPDNCQPEPHSTHHHIPTEGPTDAPTPEPTHEPSHQTHPTHIHPTHPTHPTHHPPQN